MSSSSRAIRGAAAAVLLAALAGCSLEEVTIPLGEEVLVVQGVMSLADSVEQVIVVERSLTGTIDVPDQDSMRAPPRPPLPVTGASVVVLRDDGASLLFGEQPDEPGIYRAGGIQLDGFLAEGRVYTLRVEVPDGRVVTGRMRMPGFPAVSGIPDEGARLNRDRDTLNVTWSGGGPTKGVFVQVRPRDIERRLTMFFFTDSARFRVAGNLGLPFTSDEHAPVVWIAGTRQTFSVTAVDTNLFDFTRSGNEPFTGSGFINTLTGALGVFGGAAPVNRTYDVVADVDHPWEGRYQLRGRIGTDSLGAELDLFVNFEDESRTLIGALANAPTGLLLPRAESAGWVEDGNLVLVVLRDMPGPAIAQDRMVLAGSFNPAGTTLGQISSRAANSVDPVGDFQLVRVP